MEVSLSSRAAPPLKRPSGFASTTVPVALAPAGMRTLPSRSTGLATVAEKLCPGWLIFEPTDSPSRTVITAPAGITAGAASGLAFSVLAVCPLSELIAPPAPAPELVSVELGLLELGLLAESVEGVLLQPSSTSEK